MYPPLLLSLLRPGKFLCMCRSRNRLLEFNIGPSIDSSTCMSSVRVSLPLNPLCEVESSVFTTPGDVSPVAMLTNYWTCMWT